MSVQGFWGLPLQPGHKYTQVISVPFQILMATLADEEQITTKSSLNVIVDQKEFVLCNLIPGKIEQQQLNVHLTEGEEITLFVKGRSTIHLTGNYIFDSTLIGNTDNSKIISDESDESANNEKISNEIIINEKASNPVNAIRVNDNANSTGIMIVDEIENNKNNGNDDKNDNSNNNNKKNSPSKAKRLNEDNENDENNKKSKKAKRALKSKQLEQPDQSLDKNQSSSISAIYQEESLSQTTVAEKKKEQKKRKKDDDDDKKNDNKKMDEKGKRYSISVNNQPLSNKYTGYKDESPSPPPHSPYTIPLTDNFEEFEISPPTFLNDINSNEHSLPSITTATAVENTYDDNDDHKNNDNNNNNNNNDNNSSTNTNNNNNNNNSTNDLDEPQNKIKYLPNGLIVEDKKVGTGPSAKFGNKVGLRYLGKLSRNGKIFDKNTNGKPFRFILGKGQVIRGWDIGITGMRVGGERKLTIPSHLAYGRRGMPPDIPPNSDLIFDVKMVDYK